MAVSTDVNQNLNMLAKIIKLFCIKDVTDTCHSWLAHLCNFFLRTC